MGNINEFCHCEQKENTNTEYNLTNSQIIEHNKKDSNIDEIVNYQSEKLNSVSTNKDSLSVKSKIVVDDTWKTFDISFLIDDTSYETFPEDKIIYSNEYDIEEIPKEFIKSQKNEIHCNCVIKKYTLEIFEYTSSSSSIEFNSERINTQKITINLNSLSPIYTVNFREDRIITLMKYKKYINFIEEKSFIYLKYQPKCVKSEQKDILINAGNNSQLNFIIQLIHFLADFYNDFSITE